MIYSWMKSAKRDFRAEIRSSRRSTSAVVPIDVVGGFSVVGANDEVTTRRNTQFVNGRNVAGDLHLKMLNSSLEKVMMTTMTMQQLQQLPHWQKRRAEGYCRLAQLEKQNDAEKNRFSQVESDERNV